MRKGKTILETQTAKIQGIAEKRKSDDYIKIALSSLTKNTTIKIGGVLRGVVQDFPNEESVKVQLLITDSPDDNWTNITDTNITICLVEVDHFSDTYKEELKKYSKQKISVYKGNETSESPF